MKTNFQKYYDLLDVLDVTVEGQVFRKKNGARVPVNRNKCGYYQGGIRLNGKQVGFTVHKLVAARWLPQPTSENVEVSHLDQNKLHNHASNLIWTSHAENCRMPLFKKLAREHHPFEKMSTSHDHLKKPVAQYDLNGNLIARYESVMAAARANGLKQGGIPKVAKGRCKTYGGYVWKYVDNNEN